jgi:hypothetical protein
LLGPRKATPVTSSVHEADAKVGGTHRTSFTNFGTGKSHFFGGRYLGDRAERADPLHTDKFDDPNLPGEGHSRRCVLPRLAGVAGRLSRLVDPEIPDQ